MIVIGIVYKLFTKRIFISDVIMENPFVNSVGIDMSNSEIIIYVIKNNIHCNTM